MIDCYFTKDADFHSTKFKNFNIKEVSFSALTVFEKCEFLNKKAEFNYVNFKNNTTFRDSKFPKGLDLRNINAKVENLNFLNINIKEEGTDRESFRIIKSSFDKVGNHIEANKFFALEMKAYKKELRFMKNPFKFIMFCLNNGISNFGQNYIRPLVLIILTAIIYYFISKFIFLPKFLNDFAKAILPIAKFLPTDNEFIGLIFYIIFIVLIYHLVLSIRRFTKR